MFHRDNCTVPMCIVRPWYNPPGSPPLCVQFSDSSQQDKSNPCLHSKYPLQFLWLATCGDIEISVRSSVPVHPKLNGSLKCLRPSSSPQSTNINDGFVTATYRWSAVVKEASLVAQQAATKQKGWDSLMSEVQVLFLFASSKNCSDPADSPSDPLRKILEVKGTTAAVNHLQLLFMIKFNCQFSPPALLITNIRAGAFSGEPEKGGSISIC